MRQSARAILRASIILFLLLGMPTWGIESQAAENSRRSTEILVAFIQNEWWLIRWSDNRPVCRVLTDHEGQPTPNEVQVYCGDTILNQWQATRPCTELDAKDPELAECSGLYLHFIVSEPAERTLYVTLPEPEVYLTLTGCDPVPLENRCMQLPYLTFSAREPLPNEYITAINGTIDNEPFSCPSEVCQIPLKPTTTQGVQIDFWADSSYGDSSPQYQALVRVIDTGVTQNPADAGWYVDVLSTQWLGNGVVASCAQAWQAFPPIGGVPGWLANPDDPADLVSTEPYAFLAGRLIASGVVNASQCPSGGLLENGWANTCGLETSLDEVEQWQNNFDEEIIAAAHQARIPSQLVKNVFAQESQFWPGAVRDPEIDEFGFGRMTELGADTVLLWNPEFYAQFCPLVLDKSVCQTPYSLLDEDAQAMLRGALALSADADCLECETGIDLRYSGFSINLFAETLKANCNQAGKIVENATGVIPGGISTYEDLWRFTLVNYHSGPGCLSNAVQITFNSNQGMNWFNVSSNLEPGCDTARLFVDNITGPGALGPTPVPTLPPSTPTPTATTPPPTPTPGLPTPTPTATVDRTAEPYPIATATVPPFPTDYPPPTP